MHAIPKYTMKDLWVPMSKDLFTFLGVSDALRAKLRRIWKKNGGRWEVRQKHLAGHVECAKKFISELVSA